MDECPNCDLKGNLDYYATPDVVILSCGNCGHVWEVEPQ